VSSQKQLSDSTFHFDFTSHSVVQTRDFARRLGRIAFDGLVIGLTGDLGSGKTAFVQGLAAGLDVPDDYAVTSPSYTLINEYPGRCRLYHVDLYRIENKVDFEDIGLYEILHGQGVCAVEWVEKLGDELPVEYLAVQMSIIDDVTRRISLTAHGMLTVSQIKPIASANKE
jgi:tRNA threonylcarbamoyladenosine biosynthesis protein TsaE